MFLTVVTEENETAVHFGDEIGSKTREKDIRTGTHDLNVHVKDKVERLRLCVRCTYSMGTSRFMQGPDPTAKSRVMIDNCALALFVHPYIFCDGDTL